MAWIVLFYDRDYREKEIQFVGTKSDCYRYIENRKWDVDGTIYFGCYEGKNNLTEYFCNVWNKNCEGWERNSGIKIDKLPLIGF